MICISARTFRPLLNDLARASAAHCIVTDLNGKYKPHAESKFTIIAFDALLRPRVSGGDRFVVEFKPDGKADDVKQRVMDNSDGTYTVAYLSEGAERYLVSVSLSGVNIKGSPFFIEASWSASSCKFAIKGKNTSRALAFGPDGYLFVAFDHFVCVIRADSSEVRRWGSNGTENGEFGSISGIGVGTDGLVFCTDGGIFSNHRVQAFHSDGTFVRKWGRFGSGAGQFNLPGGIAVDTKNNEVFVLDVLNYRCQVFTCEGKFLRQWGSYGDDDGQFDLTNGIAADSQGLVYIADTGNFRVQVFDRSGKFIRKWGSQGDGPGKFRKMSGIAVSEGRVFVCDSNGVQVFTNTGAFVQSFPLANAVDGAVNADGVVMVTDSKMICGLPL